MAKVLTSYYRPKPGGFCKRLFRAIEALLAAGHTVHYLAVVPFPVTHENCHFHRCPWPGARTEGLLFWTWFHVCASLMLVYIGIRYRITHTFAFGTSYGLILQPLRILRQIPLTVFLRADSIQNRTISHPGSFLIPLEHRVEACAIHGVRLYCVSQTLCDAVRTRHRRMMPRVSGVFRNDLPHASPPARAPRTPLRLVSVGILESRKNQRLLLHSIGDLQRDQAHLYLYGTGPQQTLLENMVDELGIRDRVTFAGWKDAEQIWPAADLLLLPSLHEGAPNAMLESISCGVPVLASDIPEHAEILPASQLLPTGDAAVWTRRLRAIVAAPAEQLDALRETQQAATRALQFDWDKQVCTLITGEPNNAIG